MMSNAHDFSQYFYDIWATNKFVSEKTKKMMRDFQHTEIYFPTSYGLAT